MSLFLGCSVENDLADVRGDACWVGGGGGGEKRIGLPASPEDLFH